jgi:glycerate dehydrogenase
MSTNIVFLDSKTIPVSIPRPKVPLTWTDRDSTEPDEVVTALAEADIALTNKVRLTSEILRQLPRLRYICVTAAGYDCVDIEYCKERGIQVANAPGYAAKSVAEHVLASIFLLRRRLLSYHKAATGRAWSESKVFCVHQTRIQNIQGTIVGLVGSGSIAQEVARLCQAVGMHVLFSERKNSSTIRPGYTPFTEVLRQSDVLSLHCPLTPETRSLIGERELSMMKPTSVLVNTARGALVDERALEQALLNETIAGAALDVLQTEPPHDRHRFLTTELDNLLLTPHVAWASNNGIETLVNTVSRNLCTYFEGRAENRIA